MTQRPPAELIRDNDRRQTCYTLAHTITPAYDNVLIPKPNHTLLSRWQLPTGDTELEETMK